MRMIHMIGALLAAKEARPNYVLSYSGNHTVEEVIYDGMIWEQWTFITSGVLRLVEGIVPLSNVWLCSGGACGMGGSSSSQFYRTGGHGGYAKSENDISITADVSVVIGAGATTSGAKSGQTSFADLIANGAMNGTSDVNRYGGTGGGSNGGSINVAGDGIQKYPYGDSINFANRPHCAGAGAGGYSQQGANTHNSGGRGGTNGGNGSTLSTATSFASALGGIGGAFGGGKGGDCASNSTDNSTDGTFYGAGGGGKSYTFYASSAYAPTGYRKGYQGVAYLRIPLGVAA